MKTERRPELVQSLPLQPPSGISLWFQKYGTRVLVAITLVALAFAIYRYRANNAQRRIVAAQNALMQARLDLAQLQGVILRPDIEPETAAVRRNQFYTQALTELSEVQADAGDDHPNLMAEYYTASGDVNWAMANARDFPQATTRPAMALPRQPDDFLHSAETNYQQVLDRFTDQSTAWVTAQMGLAAIDENRLKWDSAAKRYQAIQARSDLSAAFQNMAEQRLMLLQDIRTPVHIGPLATQPITATASTMPATMSPAIMPSTTMPTTLPTH